MSDLGIQPVVLEQNRRLPEIYKRQENYELLTVALLTGTFVSLYTAPTGSYPTGANHQAEINDICVCNTDTTARAFYVCIVAPAGSATISNSRFWGTPIAASTSYFMNTGRILIPNGYSVYAKADTTSLVSLSLQGLVYR